MIKIDPGTDANINGIRVKPVVELATGAPAEGFDPTPAEVLIASKARKLIVKMRRRGYGPAETSRALQQCVVKAAMLQKGKS